MPQEYTVVDVQEVGEPDQYGNKAYTVAFEEYKAGTAFMKAQRAPEIGTKEYGVIEQATAKSGKTYTKFTRKQQETGWSQAGAHLPQKAISKSEPRDTSMYRCNALNNAIAMLSGNDKVDPSDVTEVAQFFFEWLTGEKKTETIDLNEVNFDE